MLAFLLVAGFFGLQGGLPCWRCVLFPLLLRACGSVGHRHHGLTTPETDARGFLDEHIECATDGAIAGH